MGIFADLKEKGLNQLRLLSHLARHENATPLKLANALLVTLQFKLFRSTRVFGYPYQATIEPTNLCNLSCPLCPTGMKPAGEPKGVMKFDEFRTIVDRLAPYLYDLELHDWGEPLLNPDIVRMIAYARAKNIKTRLSSNLCLLAEEKARELVLSGLNCLFVSADGVTQDVYEVYRKGGSIEKCIAAIRALENAKKELNSKTPEIVFNFITFRHNVHQKKDAMRLARELGIGFRDNRPMINFGLLGPFEEAFAAHAGFIEDLPSWLEHRNRVQAERRNNGFCDWPWVNMEVAWDGTVKPCCYVYSIRHGFGNLLRQDFKEIWNGEKYRNARLLIGKGKASDDCLCLFCREHAG